MPHKHEILERFSVLCCKSLKDCSAHKRIHSTVNNTCFIGLLNGREIIESG